MFEDAAASDEASAQQLPCPISQMFLPLPTGTLHQASRGSRSCHARRPATRCSPATARALIASSFALVEKSWSRRLNAETSRSTFPSLDQPADAPFSMPLRTATFGRPEQCGPETTRLFAMVLLGGCPMN